MDKHSPRHARHLRKRHQMERADAIDIDIDIDIGVLGIVISVLVGLGIIGPSAGHSVAPAPMVVCYAVHATAYCPVIELQSPSP
jgi:hypothetical protein